MIASCPSCGTLYKHEACGSATRGRCAKCDTVVHLAVRRHYAVIRGGLPDDRSRPVLASAGSRVSASASGGGDVTDRPGAVSGPGDHDAHGPSTGGTGFSASAGAFPSLALAAPDARGVAVAASRDAAAEPAVDSAVAIATESGDRSAASRSLALPAAILGLTLGALVGMVAGWGLDGDPVVWWSGGALGGAIAGWGLGMRWTSRAT